MACHSVIFLCHFIFLTFLSFSSSVSFKFGIITCAAGIVGVWLGAETARRWRVRRKNGDPLVCAIGLISCTPFLYVSLLLAHTHINIAYVSINNVIYLNLGTPSPPLAAGMLNCGGRSFL